MGWLLASCALLIALNALFVLMEYALIKVRSSRIEVLARRGNPKALRVQEIQGRMDHYLAAIQVGLTLIAMALGWLGEPTMARWVEGGLGPLAGVLPREAIVGISFGLGLLLLSWLQGVFGELLPRAVGIQKAEAVALWGAAMLQKFTVFFRVPATIMSWSSKSILRLAGLKPSSHLDSALTEEEMRVLLGDTQESGALPLERLLLLENLFDFGAAKVSEAMTQCDKVVYLSLNKSWKENMEIVRSRRLSRYPLCEDGLESVVGMVHIKDIFLKGGEFDLRSIRRDLFEVSDGEALEKLLKLFPDKGIHMALVRNADGRAAGVITLEDMIEELVGEIHDEFDLPHAWSFMDVVVSQAVAVGLAPVDKKAVISGMLSRLCACAPELKEEEVLQVVWERELKFSSGVGRGVAVPHGRLPNLTRPMVAVARFAKPVSFSAPDNVPVRLVFLILTPASAPVLQLKVLGRIASLVTNDNLRNKLLRAKTAEAMVEILRTADTLLAV